jgi:hypothetical protein
LQRAAYGRNPSTPKSNEFSHHGLP